MNTELEALRSRNPGVEILPRGTGDALPDGPKGILKSATSGSWHTRRTRPKSPQATTPACWVPCARSNKRSFILQTGSTLRSAVRFRFFYVLKNSLRQSLSALPAPSRREPWGGAVLFLVQKAPS